MADRIVIDEKLLTEMPIEELGAVTQLSRALFVKRYAALQDIAQGAMSDNAPIIKKRGGNAKAVVAVLAGKKAGTKKPRKARKERGAFTALAKKIVTDAKTIAGKDWRKQLRDAGASNATTLLKQAVKQGYAKETTEDTFELVN